MLSRHQVLFSDKNHFNIGRFEVSGSFISYIWFHIQHKAFYLVCYFLYSAKWLKYLNIIPDLLNIKKAAINADNQKRICGDFCPL